MKSFKLPLFIFSYIISEFQLCTLLLATIIFASTTVLYQSTIWLLQTEQGRCSEPERRLLPPALPICVIFGLLCDMHQLRFYSDINCQECLVSQVFFNPFNQFQTIFTLFSLPYWSFHCHFSCSVFSPDFMYRTDFMNLVTRQSFQINRKLNFANIIGPLNFIAFVLHMGTSIPQIKLVSHVYLFMML